MCAIPADRVTDSDSHDASAPLPWGRRAWVQDVLPLGTSVALHLAVIVVGLLIYRTIRELAKPPVPAAPPISLLGSGPSPLAMPGFPGNPGPPTLADLASVSAGQVTAESAFATAAPSSAVPSFTGPNAAAGASHGNPFAPAKGTTGAPWGVPSGNGVGTVGGGTGPFALPPAARPRRVVFLCDASGSMLPVFARLKVELNAAVNRLDVSDTFNVIFFADGTPTAAFAEAMPATEQNKGRAADAIADAVCAGGTQPIPAIRRGLAERPDVLLILTDGFDQVSDFDAVAAAVRDANRDGVAVVNCTLLQSGDDPRLVAVLRRIASENRGTVTTIAKDEF